MFLPGGSKAGDIFNQPMLTIKDGVNGNWIPFRECELI